MVSLNDLEAQIAALGSDIESDEGSDAGHDAGIVKDPPQKAKKAKAKKKAKGKARRTGEGDAVPNACGDPLRSRLDDVGGIPKKRKKSGMSADEQDAHPIAGDAPADRLKDVSASEGGAGQKKRRNAAFQVCFRYLQGSCKFDDCAFRHVKPSKLEVEEQAQVLQELQLRKFDPQLAEVIKNLNIPRCRDFHQKGVCARKQGKCHYWHLDNAAIARWAGFPFWCEPCKKGFTSEQQILDHNKGRAHRDTVEAQGNGDSASPRGVGRGAAQSGRGVGRGGSDGRGVGRGSARGGGDGNARGRGVGRGG